MAISQYLSPHGTVNLVKDNMLEESTYQGYAYALEIEECIYRYINGRDVKLITNIHHPGDDIFKDEYRCEISCEFHNEKKHGKLTGVSG